jgi:uncharacterized protein YvpB
MKVQLEVPFWSQKHNVDNEDYINNSCGIVCVKMILGFAGKESGDVDELIKEGHIVGGKSEAGWNHETLLRLLRNHGVLAYRQEFISHTVDLEKEKGEEDQKETLTFRENGIEKIKGSIDYGYPVMVSVKPGFGENKGDHLVLVVGYDDENFYINDPQRKGYEKDPISVPLDKFKEFWKGLTIFVEFELSA